MKRTLLVLLLSTTVFLGCKKEDEKQTQSKFAGSYKGNYSGGDAGSIIVDVAANGAIKGTAVSSRTIEVFSITGNVDDNGAFTGKTDIGTTFTGNFTTSSVTGNWSNTSLKLSGTWSGNKQ